MKIYFHGWFGGFIDKTNPGLNYEFFINLFTNVYNETCEIGILEDSDILCEYMAIYSNTFQMHSESALNKKKWKHTYCFSGESWTNKLKDKYDCVLWGERNNKNIVNIPLFIPYIYTNNFIEQLETPTERRDIPKKDVCVVVSNPNGAIRNKFLQKLEKHCNVTYMGRYKNNIGHFLPYDYNDKRFINLISNFKFIISMENSENDTYITEKIIHGMIGKTIPVYWGSKRITDYFNKNRFLNLVSDDDECINKLINRIIEIKNDDKKWLDIVNQNEFAQNGKLWRNLDLIASDIKSLLTHKKWNHINRIHVITNKDAEKERYSNMKKLFNDVNIDKSCIKNIGPTYKHTISDNDYQYHSNKQWVLRLRGPHGTPLSKGSLSLILNYRENLRDIERNYKDGNFIIFESDLLLGKDFDKFNDFLNEINTKNWDAINIGMDTDEYYNFPVAPTITGYRNWGEPFSQELINYLINNLGNDKANYCSAYSGCYGKKPFFEVKNKNISNKNIIFESDLNDKYELVRKFHSRCCEAVIFRYNCIKKYLDYIDELETNLSCPNDYVMTSFFENNVDIKHLWCKPEFFKQGSNLGIIARTYEI